MRETVFRQGLLQFVRARGAFKTAQEIFRQTGLYRGGQGAAGGKSFGSPARGAYRALPGNRGNIASVALKKGLREQALGIANQPKIFSYPPPSPEPFPCTANCVRCGSGSGL